MSNQIHQRFMWTADFIMPNGAIRHMEYPEDYPTKEAALAACERVKNHIGAKDKIFTPKLAVPWYRPCLAMM